MNDFGARPEWTAGVGEGENQVSDDRDEKSNLTLFDQDAQLPDILGAREYVRYEFDPGLHTCTVQPLVPGLPGFGQWVHGDLEEGGIYRGGGRGASCSFGWHDPDAG